MNKKFCYEIFKNISIKSLNDQIAFSPCCMFNGSYTIDNEIDISKIWNSDNRKNIAKMSLQDSTIPGCHGCQYNEDRGVLSRRQSSKKLWEEFFQDTNINISGPESLEYSVGNLCNLKCIICGPQDSSAWISDYQRLYPNENVEKFRYKKNNQVLINSADSLSNIKLIHFYGGGEPFLSDTHVEILRLIKEKKGLSDVRVSYNTNGTVIVSDEVLKLWEECLLVELYFSIDDVGPRFEYQRFGAKWSSVCNNIDWFKKNMPSNHMFNINCVWSYLNFYYLDELSNWFLENLKTNRYGDPSMLYFQTAYGYYTLHTISSKIFDKLSKKFENHNDLLNRLNSLKIDNTHTHEYFWESINKIDKIRNQSFEKICPEWASLLKLPHE